MTVRYELNEGQTGWLDVSFFDTDGETPAVPSGAVTYTIHDLKTDTEVVGETNLSAAAMVTVPIPPAVTAILDDSRKFETRRITIVAPFGVDDQFVDYFDFHVENLHYRP